MVVCGVFDISFKKGQIYVWKNSRDTSVSTSAPLCQLLPGATASVQVCRQQREAGSTAVGPAVGYSVNLMLFKVKNVCLFPRCMLGQNLSHNTV